MSEWMPIETAPKDVIILLYRPSAIGWGMVTLGKYNYDLYAKKPRPFWEGWLKIGDVTQWREWQPTHWMPLPEPPK